MARLKIGIRVNDPYLGDGEIVKRIGTGLVMVQFDQTPPFQYNCSTNPALSFESDLKPIKESA